MYMICSKFKNGVMKYIQSSKQEQGIVTGSFGGLFNWPRRLRFTRTKGEGDLDL